LVKKTDETIEDTWLVYSFCYFNHVLDNGQESLIAIETLVVH